jgi:hypothetical protein
VSIGSIYAAKWALLGVFRLSKAASLINDGNRDIIVAWSSEVLNRISLIDPQPDGKGY